MISYNDPEDPTLLLLEQEINRIGKQIQDLYPGLTREQLNVLTYPCWDAIKADFGVDRDGFEKWSLDRAYRRIKKMID